MNIYLLQYNNYANRTIKGYDTLAEYLSEVGDNGYAQELDVNRSISDNLSCSITFNDAQKDITSTSMPNYCIITDGDDQSPGNIVSRWFVLSCKHKGGVRSDSEGGQYTIELKRDVIYDFKTNIENSTMLCSRGYIDITSPLFLNKDTDEFPVNSIKYKEVMLKEVIKNSFTKVGFPWVYFYRTKNRDVQETFSNQVDFGYVNATYEDTVSNPFRASTAHAKFVYDDCVLHIDDGEEVHDYPLSSDDMNDLIIAGITKVKDSEDNEYKLVETNEPITTKIERASKGYYLVQFVFNSSGTQTYDILTLQLENAKTLFIRNSELADAIFQAAINGYDVSITLREYDVSTTVTVKSQNFVSFKLTNSGIRTHGAFDVLCVPYADNISINGHIYTKELVELMVEALAMNDATYDIQILPYAPVELLEEQEGEYYARDLEITSFAEFKIEIDGYAPYFGTSLYRNYINPFTLSKFKREFDIPTPDEYEVDSDNNDEPYAFVVPNGAVGSQYEENKVGLNCYSTRLVSPDSQAIEDIDPFFNYTAPRTGDNKGEFITGFHCYMKFQPYNPYIQILPIYKGWNKDFEDYRGLICGSGFSLAMASDKWAQFALNNKNYSAQFDREIEGMRFNQLTSAISGVANSGAMALKGASVGGVGGAIAGGAAGGLTTISDLYASQFNIETAQKEFNWNIQNIKAMSRTLKQIDAQNPNFRFYPYLEVFKSTDNEMDRLIDYIKHHGSKIGAEGLFREFIDTNHTYPFIQGTIDIYAGNDVSSDVLAQINEELSIGIKYLVDLTPIQQ